jgi:hypothetical protein
MAQYKHLPIYKTTYELLEKVTRKTKDFPRDFKYSLGDKIRNECIELVVFIYKANTLRNQRGDNLKQNAFKERKKAVKSLSVKGCWFNGKLTKLVRQDKSKCIYV